MFVCTYMARLMGGLLQPFAENKTNYIKPKCLLFQHDSRSVSMLQYHCTRAHSANKLPHSTKLKPVLLYGLHFAHREGLNHTEQIVSFTREHVIKKRQMIG